MRDARRYRRLGAELPSLHRCYIENLPDGPVGYKSSRIIDLRPPLRHEEHALVTGHGCLRSVDGFRPAAKDRHHHLRVNHDIAERYHGHALAVALRRPLLDASRRSDVSVSRSSPWRLQE